MILPLNVELSPVDATDLTGHKTMIETPPPIRLDSKFQLHEGKDILLSNIGIHLKFVTTMQSSKDQILLTFVTPLPNITDLLESVKHMKSGFSNTLCETTTKIEGGLKNVVCEQHNEIINTHLKTIDTVMIRARDNLKHLERYIPQLKAELNSFNVTKRVRNRRVFAAIAVGVWAKTRTDSLQADIDYLKNRHNTLVKFVMNLGNTVKILAQTTKNDIDTLFDGLNDTNIRLSEFSRTVVKEFDQVRSILGILSSRLITTAKWSGVMATVTTQGFILNQAVNQFQLYLENLLNMLTISFHELEVGKLPNKLVTHSDFEAILQKAGAELYQIHPEYELLSTKASDYYQMTNAIYAIEGYDLLIQIPILLKEKSQGYMDVYNIVSFYVPTSIFRANKEGVDESELSYTKIALYYQTIAISERSYILMHANQLQDCTFFAGTKVCNSVLLQAHKTVSSCEASFFWNPDVATINRLCNIQYFHNMEVPAQVFETDSLLLLANIRQDWEFQCADDKIPRKQIGKKFSVILKSNLCRCTLIVGNDHYLQQKLTGCSENITEVQIRYPTNSLVLYNLHQITDNLNHGLDYFALHHKEIDFDIPDLKVIQVVNRSQVLYDRPRVGVNFDKVVNMLDTNKEIFMQSEDMLAKTKDMSFGSWFGKNHFPMGIVFILSLISIICLIIFVLYCYRQHKSNILGKALSAVASGIIPLAETPKPSTSAT